MGSTTQHPLAGGRGPRPLHPSVRRHDRRDPNADAASQRRRSLHPHVLAVGSLRTQPGCDRNRHVPHPHRRQPHAHRALVHGQPTRSGPGRRPQPASGRRPVRGRAAARRSDVQRVSSRRGLLHDQPRQGGLPVSQDGHRMGRERPERALAQPEAGPALLLDLQLRGDTRIAHLAQGRRPTASTRGPRPARAAVSARHRRRPARHSTHEYSNIVEMDEQVGEILAELEADGLLEQTIVFWYTDHGGPLRARSGCSTTRA